LNIFRADPTNVGDAFCPPFIYFPFKNKRYIDILNINQNTTFHRDEIIIVGGGGLGKEFFKEKIDTIIDLKEKYNLKIIAWGVGYDLNVDKSSILSPEENLISNIFDGFDIIGTRVYLKQKYEQKIYEYVPCVSCMHDALYTLRNEQKKLKKVGVYSHKRIPLNTFFPEYDHLTNEGMDLINVLNFISSYEFIITNSYHGVYWATLLNKKVICVPFKSGLYSFKDKPTYLSKYQASKDDFEKAINYPYSLDESRELNFNFYRKIFEEFGGI
jgi:hypothetical protein